jgi:hypothetical protein
MTRMTPACNHHLPVQQRRPHHQQRRQLVKVLPREREASAVPSMSPVELHGVVEPMRASHSYALLSQKGETPGS